MAISPCPSKLELVMRRRGERTASGGEERRKLVGAIDSNIHPVLTPNHG